MKEIYTAPEAKLFGFRSAEKIAVIDFDEFVGGAYGKVNGMNTSENDIIVDSTEQ